MVDLICVHGGSKLSLEATFLGNWYYGYQFGYIGYGVPYMLDYVSGDWGKYMDELRSNRPRLAVVMDYRNRAEMDEMHTRCLDVVKLNIMPIVVAKFAGCLATIPHFAKLNNGTVMPVRVGISTPTTRGYMNEGYIPTAEEIREDGNIFPHRHIHLLGGHPDQWLYLMRYYAQVGATVASIDGNNAIEQARQFGKMWSRNGYYKELPRMRYNTKYIAAASMRNAQRYLDNPLSKIGSSARVQICMQATGELPTQKSLFVA